MRGRDFVCKEKIEIKKSAKYKVMLIQKQARTRVGNRQNAIKCQVDKERERKWRKEGKIYIMLRGVTTKQEKKEENERNQ